MKKALFALMVPAMLLCFSGAAGAHFGMVIPSDSMVMMEDNRTVHLQVSFSHPFEGIGMTMEKPKRFGVVAAGKAQDLLGALERTKVMGHPAWQIDYRVKRPGAYHFFLEPTPYWEPARAALVIAIF